MIRTTFLVFALWAAAATAGDMTLTAKMLTFTHEPFEAGEILPCKHEIENAASQDWAVVCTSADGKTVRRYSVHLWVTRYPHASAPRLSVEILYWVTDRTNPAAPIGNGTTVWLHLRDETALSGIDLRQSVENDTAGLYLKIKPDARG